METTRKFAILAPVPESHLISGLDAIAAQLNSDDITTQSLPKVAFGSMAFEVFRKADELRKTQAVEVLICATDAKGDQPLNAEIWWRARYIGHVPSRNGRYPGKSHFRPPIAASERPVWAIYWEVQELQRLKAPIAVASLQPLGQKTNLKPRLVPDGAILTEYPFAAFVALAKQATANR